MLLETKVQQIDGKEFRIKNVSCSDNRFAASVECIGPAGSEGRADSFLLKVVLAVPVITTDAQAVVTVEGDLPEDARLEIPIHVTRER
jgi:hypothetical protein